jgi:hypothetical protein
VRARSEILMPGARLDRTIACCALLLLAAAGPAIAGPGEADLDRSYARAALDASGLSLLTGDSLEQTVERTASERPSAGAAPEQKNPMLAFVKSAILPGWGELDTGHTGRARAFMSAEVAIWAGYLAFTVQEDMRTDDYEEYAQIFAEVPDGASGEYYQDIADYMRSEGEDSFNEAVRAEARSLFPDDLDAQRQYLTENGYFGSLTWDWGDRDRLEDYRDLRHEAAVSRRNAFYMTGLAVLNRAVSAIDSAWMAKRHNAGLRGAPPARLSVAPEFSDGSVGGRLAVEFQF